MIIEIKYLEFTLIFMIGLSNIFILHRESQISSK
jgi:hypothetical protein